MATPRSQRIGIWIIAILMFVSTVALFATMILQRRNEPIVRQQQEEEYSQMMEELAKEMAENNRPLAGHEATPFDGEDVDKLDVEVLEKGDGDKVGESDTISASYFGWISDGTIFDSTNQSDQDNTPREFSLNEVISGWTEGLGGLRVGTVARLTIPADMAYGEFGSPPIIGENEPLKFIVVIEDIVRESDE